MPSAAGIEPFERHHRRYDGWFERHPAAYQSELLAVRALTPRAGRGLEIGVGTGRFAAPLGVEFGIDPAAEMLAYAKARGIRVARALAEALPFADAAFDYALMVTTLCFLDDPAAALAEARRVLRPAGALVIGFIDRESVLGRRYRQEPQASPFYRGAKFHSAAEVQRLLRDTGFGEPVEARQSDGGEGGFVVVRAPR